MISLRKFIQGSSTEICIHIAETIVFNISVNAFWQVKKELTPYFGQNTVWDCVNVCKSSLWFHANHFNWLAPCMHAWFFYVIFNKKSPLIHQACMYINHQQFDWLKSSTFYWQWNAWIRESARKWKTKIDCWSSKILISNDVQYY